METKYFVDYLLLVICCRSAVHAENSGYFWHVTDMHWDPTYTDTEVAWSCNDRTQPDYGEFGDYLCDSPWKLVDSAVNAMKLIHPNPDFLIWTGDDTPHIYNDTILDKEVVLDIIFNLTDLLQGVFPNTTTFSALGNHDWSPKSQLPPNSDPMYDLIAEKWSDWLYTQDAVDTFKKGAYYTMKMEESNLRFIILNTNLYYTSNKLTADMDDPAGQFQWLNATLSNSSADGENVIIIGHVPPGVFEKHRDYSWYYPDFNNKLLSIMNEYNDTISSIHFAHHHTDTFRILYENGIPVSSFFLAPAVAPWETTLEGVMGGKGNNPAIRLVEYDRTRGTVLDIHQYYLNLTQANIDGETNWELEYQGTDYYSEPDMTTFSLHRIAQKMWTDDDIFNKYYLANGALFDLSEEWDYETRIVHCCAATELYFDEYKECYDFHMGGPGNVASTTRGNIILLLTVVTYLLLTKLLL